MFAVLNQKWLAVILKTFFFRGGKRNEQDVKTLSVRAGRLTRKVNHNDVSEQSELNEEDWLKQEIDQRFMRDREMQRFGAWLRGPRSLTQVRQWARRARRDTKLKLSAGVLEEILSVQERLLNLEVTLMYIMIGQRKLLNKLQNNIKLFNIQGVTKKCHWLFMF